MWENRISLNKANQQQQKIITASQVASFAIATQLVTIRMMKEVINMGKVYSNIKANNDKSYLIKPNTIKDRGLPLITQERIQANSAVNDLLKLPNVELAYPGAFNSALKTIIWFMRGSKIE